MIYKLEITKSAQDDLAKFDKKVLTAIRKHLKRLAETADQMKHLPLKGPFAGLYKRRAGKFRIIYDLQRNNQLIVIVRIGNRDDIYEE